MINPCKDKVKQIIIDKLQVPEVYTMKQLLDAIRHAGYGNITQKYCNYLIREIRKYKLLKIPWRRNRDWTTYERNQLKQMITDNNVSIGYVLTSMYTVFAFKLARGNKSTRDMIKKLFITEYNNECNENNMPNKKCDIEPVKINVQTITKDIQDLIIATKIRLLKNQIVTITDIDEKTAMTISAILVNNNKFIIAKSDINNIIIQCSNKGDINDRSIAIKIN